MTKNLIVIMMGLVAMVLAFLSKIPLLKIIAIIFAVVLILFGVLFTIGIILEKREEKQKQNTSLDK